MTKATLLATASIRPDPRYKYDFIVVIGRMRPLHNWHLRILRKAMTLSQIVVMMIGSARQARTPGTPFLASEVDTYIRGAMSEEENARLVTVPVMDVYNDTIWTRDVQRALDEVVTTMADPAYPKPSIGLLGFAKDHTSGYLDLFPGWGSETVDSDGSLSATTIRDDYYENAERSISLHADELPPNMMEFLREFARTPEYEWLVEEHRAYRKIRETAFDKSGHPHFINTVEGVVIQSGHVLVTQRETRPGLGLLSLVGGHLGTYETHRQTLVRRVVKEYRLKIHPAEFEDRIVANQTMDHPRRSERGRVISQAILVKLRDGPLAKVRAPGAAWIPLASLEPEMWFEDGYHTVQTMVARLEDRY